MTYRPLDDFLLENDLFNHKGTRYNAHIDWIVKSQNSKKEPPLIERERAVLAEDFLGQLQMSYVACDLMDCYPMKTGGQVYSSAVIIYPATYNLTHSSRGGEYCPDAVFDFISCFARYSNNVCGIMTEHDDRATREAIFSLVGPARLINMVGKTVMTGTTTK